MSVLVAELQRSNLHETSASNNKIEMWWTRNEVNDVQMPDAITMSAAGPFSDNTCTFYCLEDLLKLKHDYRDDSERSLEQIHHVNCQYWLDTNMMHTLSGES